MKPKKISVELFSLQRLVRLAEQALTPEVKFSEDIDEMRKAAMKYQRQLIDDIKVEIESIINGEKGQEIEILAVFKQEENFSQNEPTIIARKNVKNGIMVDITDDIEKIIIKFS